jgi:hypothetical protein
MTIEDIRCGRKLMRLIFYLPKVLIFSIINVIPFKIVPLGCYTLMETLFPLLVTALEKSSIDMVFLLFVTLF